MSTNERHILQITPSQVTPALKTLFNPSDPNSLRCTAVLDGHTRGQIFTDDIYTPSWGVVYETASGSLYLGGQVHYPALRKLISRLRRQGDVVVGMWPNDSRWQLFSRRPDYSGFTVSFSDRDGDHNNHKHLVIPEGCDLCPMDHFLFERTLGKSHYLSMYGSTHRALDAGYGVCLTAGHELLCEAFAAPFVQGKIEIGVTTHASHRNKGFATLTCSYLIAQMEQQGFITLGNCARDNQASISLARKLGYKTEKEYRLITWYKAAD